MEKEIQWKINVSDLISCDIGRTKTVDFSEKIDKIDEFEITKPITGKIEITNLSQSLNVKAFIKTTINQICSKCAQIFQLPISLSYEQEYSTPAGPETFPIKADKTINLYPSIRQEIILAIPIKPLCQKEERK